MATHAIEVDDDVLAYLRSKVRDFNETPNAVLRRELRLDDRPPVVRREPAAYQPTAPVAPPVAPPAGTGRYRPALPLGVPEALSQILEVVSLVRRGGADRVSATLQVAKRRGVTRVTIGDKYGRQLGLSTETFDRLLEDADLKGLRTRLLEKFPRHRGEIVTFLDALRRSSSPA